MLHISRQLCFVNSSQSIQNIHERLEPLQAKIFTFCTFLRSYTIRSETFDIQIDTGNEDVTRKIVVALVRLTTQNELFIVREYWQVWLEFI